MTNPRWKRRPEGSTWGDWGPDDQLGRLNLLTPQKVMEGIAEVKHGKSFCLSLPLDYPGGNVLSPRRFPPVLAPTMRGENPNMTYPLSRDDPRLVDVACDDLVTMHLQYSTQWDSLAHMGQEFDADGDGKPEILFYNGFRAGEDVVGSVDYRDGKAVKVGPHIGAKKLGIENVAATCVQGRGVMIDLEHHYGREKSTTGYDDLMRVIEKDKVVIEKGDMVCIRTGFADVLLDNKKNISAHTAHNSCAALDGGDEKLLQWITDTQLVALFCDNYAVERLPVTRHCDDHCEMAPLHQHCLFRLGVYLGEMWLLGELADWLRAHNRSRFLLTAPPLRLPGAVGSPTTPVATV